MNNKEYGEFNEKAVSELSMRSLLIPVLSLEASNNILALITDLDLIASKQWQKRDNSLDEFLWRMLANLTSLIEYHESKFPQNDQEDD